MYNPREHKSPREAYALEKYGERTVLEAFVKSDIGHQAWVAHYDMGVTICDSQSEWTPMQRNFLMLAADEYGPDDTDIPDDPT